MATLGSRFKNAWSVFFGRNNDYEVQSANPMEIGYGTTYRPDRTRVRIASERTIISSIYTKLASDASGIDIRHVKLDDQDRYLKDMDSGLNNCLTVEANLDQAARQFKMDIFLSMFSEGCIAIVPVDTTINPNVSGSYDILTMRVGRIVDWYPQHVRVNLYNENTGRRQDVIVSKSNCGIVENPFYNVMNEPNSTYQRLMRKLGQLDTSDDNNSSGKLDLIIQLPYTIRSEVKRAEAERRRSDIELQLTGSKYGIAYADATEKITQLNRPVENKLFEQVKDLREQLFFQLGLTPEIMNGTADENAMLNYMHRTIEPLLDAVTQSMLRVFLTKTARTQKQSIRYFRDPFKLVPVSSIADLADKLIRNQVFSANEFRQILGRKPSADPKADQLNNPNMPNEDTGFGPDGLPVDQGAETAAVSAENSLDQGMADLGIS